MLLDLALRAIGIDPERIDGYASAGFTHSAIAAFVASGMADLGFGVEPAAHHFSRFHPGRRRRLLLRM